MSLNNARDRFGENWGSYARCLKGAGNSSVGVLRRGSMAVVLILMSRPVLAQEALQNSIAGDAAAQARRLQQESRPYTFKSGDLRVLMRSSLGLEWNDNVNLAHQGAENDFILQPSLGFDASYPVTAYNLLNLSVDFGYQEYIEHGELSRWNVRSGSEVSFDVYVKDFWFNFHDRFSYVQDAATEPAVAGTGSYGTFENTAGLSVTWDLEDVTLTLGYDHRNNSSTSSQFDYTDSASEMVVARAGLRVHPKVTVGFESSASFMTYDQKVLNNNNNYSFGIYADWRPGSYFSVQPHFGYTIYDSQQTSTTNIAQDVSTWYIDLTISHQPTEFMSYALSAGHELRPGIQSDSIEAWYFRPNLSWNVMKDIEFRTSLFYEHGDLNGGNQAGLSDGETRYDWYGGGLGLSCSPMKRVKLSLDYRLTLRSSNVTSREYTQNMVALVVAYSPP